MMQNFFQTGAHLPCVKGRQMDGWYIDSYVSIRQIYLNEMHISSKHLNLRHNNTK